MNSTSISLRFSAVILVVLGLLGLSSYFVLKNVYRLELRVQANTVADNVSSFGKWVAGYGRVWVNQNSDSSFLGTQDLINLENAISATSRDEDLVPHSQRFFSKNPALAQREFSEVVAASDSPATFRLTSDNYMNPLNEPDAFELEAIQSIRESGSGFFEKFDDASGQYRFARAVIHKASCISCHGDPKSAPQDVITRYGSQRGFGFNEGDLAGVISVKLPQKPFSAAVAPFIGVREVSLILVAFAVALLFLQIAVIRPLKKLTRDAEAASLGETPDIDMGKVKQDTRNEIERLGLSIRRMNTSTKMAISQMRKSGRQ